MSVQNATEPAGSDGPSGGWGLKRDLPRLGWTIAIAATLCLVVGHAWPHDLARTGKIYVALSWASFVVMTLRYHAGLLLVLVAVGAGVGRRWKLAGFASLVGLWAVWPTWALLVPRPPQATAGSTFRVMSVNLLCVNRQTGALAREIETADAHVLLLQEYTSQWHETLATRLAARYPHRDARPR
ncbi:MAG: hypothetical protein OER86_03575, partial [Phycisphaerae bacterium]|nr:hypothetical protein [Phycisphaerae bacterium]